MNRILKSLIMVAYVIIIYAGYATTSDTVVSCYVNPLDVSIADPQILKDSDGTYYLYGTTPHNSSRGFEVWSSRDLVRWRRRGWCYEKTEFSWGKDNFWAPEVIKKGDTYYLYYTAYSPAAGVRNICVATSSSPCGPFIDRITPLLDPSRGFIDAHPFFDPVTGRYFLYMMEENLRPPIIHVSRLADDLLSIDTPIQRCITATQSWEGSWIEAPFVMSHNGIYYMMYSGNGYPSPRYAVGFATAAEPMGIWTKYKDNPILHMTDAVSGPGHNAIIGSPDNTELFIVYHTHLTFAGGWQRQLSIDRIGFLPFGKEPDILSVYEGPTAKPQPLPSGVEPFVTGRSDTFSEDINRDIWNIMYEHEDFWTIKDGSLNITTLDGDIWTNRTDAANIFLQYAPEGDFSIITRVTFTPQANYEQAFILIFQDQSNYIRLSEVFSNGLKIEMSKENNGEFEVKSTDNKVRKEAPVGLRITKHGKEYSMFYRYETNDWIHMGTYTVSFGPQIQVGLGAISPGSGAARTAVFDEFIITRCIQLNSLVRHAR